MGEIRKPKFLSEKLLARKHGIYKGLYCEFKENQPEKFGLFFLTILVFNVINRVADHGA